MSKVKIEGNASGTGTLTIAAPNTNTDRTLTLPDGAGEILTDASSLPAANLTGTLPAIDGSALTGISAGAVQQVLQAAITTYWSTSSNSYSDITGLSQAITPSSTSSKILCIINVSTYHLSTGELAIKLIRDTTDLYITSDAYNVYGSGIGSSANLIYLDSPLTTSSVTYKVAGRSPVSTEVGTNKDLYGTVNGVSSITVMEIV